MADILETILAAKRLEVERARATVPVTELEAQIEAAGRKTLSLRGALEASGSGVIAEFKRKSPSKGWIHPDARVEDIAPAYAAAGASGLSVLTDREFFGGSADDLRAARALVDIPILRKEFVVDEYQLVEARAMGADAVLLIAAALKPTEAKRWAAKAHELGLEVLLEIHNELELDTFGPDVDIIGVNNRDLKVFRTDPEASVRLFEKLPSEALPITESGLTDPAVAAGLRKTGYRGFLVGEALMSKEDPGMALRTYIWRMIYA